MTFSKKEIMKIAKKSIKETMLEYEYENGNNKESVKKLYDESNNLMLGMLKQANKLKGYDLSVINKLRKEISKVNIRFTFIYLWTINKFILLTAIFGFTFYFISKFSNGWHKYLQDYIFSIIMIVYSSLLYKLIGDEFKVLFYSNYCFNYFKKRFKKKYSLVQMNIKSKQLLQENLIIEEHKIQIQKSVEIMDEIIENWKKL